MSGHTLAIAICGLSVSFGQLTQQRHSDRPASIAGVIGLIVHALEQLMHLTPAVHGVSNVLRPALGTKLTTVESLIKLSQKAITGVTDTKGGSTVVIHYGNPATGRELNHA